MGFELENCGHQGLVRSVAGSEMDFRRSALRS